MRSTRPFVGAAIQRISTGTSVPRPRTWRTIGPRFTSSIQTVESTVGAAGRRRERPSETSEDGGGGAAPIRMRRRFFFFSAMSGRAMSMRRPTTSPVPPDATGSNSCASTELPAPAASAETLLAVRFRTAASHSWDGVPEGPEPLIRRGA